MNDVLFVNILEKVNTVFKKGLSFSMLDDWMRCPWKFVFRILGLTPPGKCSYSLYLGNLFHAGMAEYFAQSGKNTLYEKKISDYPVPNNLDLQDALTMKGMSKLLVKRCIQSKCYKNILHNKKNILTFEKKLPIKSNGFPVYSKADLVFLDDSGAINVLDWKVQSRFNEVESAFFPSLSLQGKLGILGAAKKYLKDRGETLEPLVFNYFLIRNPQLKQGQQTLRDFLKRIDADIEERPDFYFVNLQVTFAISELNALKHEVDIIVRNMQKTIDSWGSINDISRTTSNCLGSYQCEYLEACAKKDITVLVPKSRF